MTSKARPRPVGEDGVLGTLKAVYEFMSQNDLDSLELTEPELQVRMVRRKPAASAPVPVPVYMNQMAAPAAVAAAPQAAAAAAPPAASVPSGLAIKSPMMGIFYRAASPSSPPFLKEGDAVKPGQVLCMIEAMKVFNEIKADFPCTVLKVLLENGKPVKSGQELFLVQR